MFGASGIHIKKMSPSIRVPESASDLYIEHICGDVEM